MKLTASLTGTAGVYFVASRLNALGYHAAITLGAVPAVDLLVSSRDGSASVSIQVKTTVYALRTRGRSLSKKPHHYEWDIGWNCARLSRSDLFYALVDLKYYEELPQVFILPSQVVARYFRKGPKGWPRARYHPVVRSIEKYRENWGILADRLALQQPLRRSSIQSL